MRFYHPELPRRASLIHPVFISFAGCPERCVFCAQDLQSGQKTVPAALLLENAIQQIDQLTQSKHPNQPTQSDRPDQPDRPVPELAFYGGTFTALPLEIQQTLLAKANELKQQGRISRVRCSTRPDAITPEILQRLQRCGLNDIELGVQSFCKIPLEASRRNYSGKIAEQACRLVQEYGFGLGIQLMPGMPGMTAEHFKHDVELCAALAPETARLYPCLVLAGTRLAELWREGKYAPWSLDEVLRHLPPAMLRLWKQGIRIIRIGLAPQAELETGVLAGPLHPALGQRLRSLALFDFLSEQLRQTNPDQINPGQADQKIPNPPNSCANGSFLLSAPKRFQGEFFGHKGELKERYAALGLTPDKIHWWNEKYFTSY